MRGIHLENVIDPRHQEFIAVGKEQAIEAVDELRAIGHRNFVGIAIENVEHGGDHYRVALRDHLPDDMGRSDFGTMLVPGPPFIHDELDAFLRIEFIHRLPVP